MLNIRQKQLASCRRKIKSIKFKTIFIIFCKHEEFDANNF